MHSTPLARPNYIEEVHKIEWPKLVKTTLCKALELKKKLLPNQYETQKIERQNIESKLDETLKRVIPEHHKKRLRYKNSLLYINRK